MNMGINSLVMSESASRKVYGPLAGEIDRIDLVAFYKGINDFPLGLASRFENASREFANLNGSNPLAAHISSKFNCCFEDFQRVARELLLLVYISGNVDVEDSRFDSKEEFTHLLKVCAYIIQKHEEEVKLRKLEKVV